MVVDERLKAIARVAGMVVIAVVVAAKIWQAAAMYEARASFEMMAPAAYERIKTRMKESVVPEPLYARCYEIFQAKTVLDFGDYTALLTSKSVENPMRAELVFTYRSRAMVGEVTTCTKEKRARYLCERRNGAWKYVKLEVFEFRETRGFDAAPEFHGSKFPMSPRYPDPFGS